jgi:ketosteroid isomerase-like protein
MDTATQIVDRYLAAWNEADERRRQDLIAEVFTEDAHYVDPIATSTGRAAIGAMIAGIQQRFDGLHFTRLGNADRHNDRIRFRWALSPVGGESVVEGTDFGMLVTDGRLAAVTGFLDKVPAQ